jgi:23S rRNA A1618 N6-methylase RlmF
MIGIVYSKIIKKLFKYFFSIAAKKESLTEMIGDKGNDPDLKSKVSEVLDKMANNKEMQDSIKEMVNNMINPPNKES